MINTKFTFINPLHSLHRAASNEKDTRFTQNPFLSYRLQEAVGDQGANSQIKEIQILNSIHFCEKPLASTRLKQNQ